MSEKSLLQYNRETPKINAKAHIDGSNIDTTRNHKATATPSYGKWGSTTIWSSQAPQIDWAKYNTKDPLANFGSTGSNKAAKAANIFGIATAALGFTGATVSAIQAGKALFGKNNAEKSSKDFNADAETSLHDLKNTADGYDDDSNLTDMETTSTNLGKSIITSTKQKDNLKRASETATNTKATLEKQRPALVNALQSFDTEKSALQADIDSLEGEINNPDLSEAEKASLKNQLEKLKQQLENNYPDSKREELAKAVKQNSDGIAAQEKTISDNKTKIKELESSIKEAEKAKNKLDKKINKKQAE